jgi:Asp/Glu/hydantoin racemase
MKLLVINPNTTQRLTDIIAARARGVAAAECEIVPVTAPFGAAYLSTPEHGLEAEKAILQLLRAHAGGFDGAVICSSSDSGLAAARATSDKPVTAMTESALLVSCMLGGPTSILIYQDRSRDGMRLRAESYGLGHQLASARVAYAFAGGIPDDEAAYRDAVIAAGIKARDEDGAASIIVGGSAASEMIGELTEATGIPVLEGISCAVKMAEALVRLRG